VVGLAPGGAGHEIGRRKSFADIGQTVARHLGLRPVATGIAFTPSTA
jgi:phosphopentomutase